MTVNWPTSVLFSVLLVCLTALVYKGVIPSHALFTLGGAIVGYVIKSSMPISAATFRRERDRISGFPQEEIPTKNELRKVEEDKK